MKVEQQCYSIERFSIVITNCQLDLPVETPWKHLLLMLRTTELNTFGMINTSYRDVSRQWEGGVSYRLMGGTPWRYDDLCIIHE